MLFRFVLFAETKKGMEGIRCEHKMSQNNLSKKAIFILFYL